MNQLISKTLCKAPWRPGQWRSSIKQGIQAFGLLMTLLSLQSCLNESKEITGCNTKTYLHTEPISPGFQAIISGINLLTLFVNKPSFLEQDSTASGVIMAAPPASFLKDHAVDTTVFQGRNVLTLRPRTGASGRHILYIHGGGWGMNIAAGTYDNLYAKIMDPTGATITLPDYGLAPYHHYQEAYRLFQAVYDDLVARVGAKNIIVMGESAGGNLAMGFTQKLKLENRPLPAQTILLFPALDGSFSNPGIAKIQDPILNVKSAREAITAWANGTDLGFYQLSPINGPLEGLPPISLFIGGRDVTSPDCLKLRAMMNAKCLPLNFFEYPQMIHGWMAIIPSASESKKAYEQIAVLINTGP